MPTWLQKPGLNSGMGRYDLVLPSGEGIPDFYYLPCRHQGVGVPSEPRVILHASERLPRCCFLKPQTQPRWVFYLGGTSEVFWSHRDALSTSLRGAEPSPFPLRGPDGSVFVELSSSLPLSLPASNECLLLPHPQFWLSSLNSLWLQSQPSMLIRTAFQEGLWDSARGSAWGPTALKGAY